jgi:hypothetical protein
MSTKSAARPSKQTLARRKNAAARQQRILAEGGRQLNMLLEKKPTKALERLQRSTGLAAKQIVAQLLVDAASDLREAKARLSDAQINTIRRMEPQGFKPTRSVRTVLKPTAKRAARKRSS